MLDENRVQQRINSLGDSWSVWITSSQVASELTREGAPLNLLFANREGVMGGVMVRGCPGHSDHQNDSFCSLLR